MADARTFYMVVVLAPHQLGSSNGLEYYKNMDLVWALFV